MSEAKPAEINKNKTGSFYADTSGYDKGSGRSNPKPAASKVNTGKKGKTGKKKKSRIGLIVLMVIVLIIGAGAAVLYYTGYLDTVLTYLGMGQEEDIETMSQEELAAWEAKLKVKEQSLKTKEEELAVLEEELKQKEQELYIKEKNLQVYGKGTKEQEYTQTFQGMISSLNEEEIAYFKKMSVVYAKMDPAKSAAVMLELYDIQKTSAIVYYMLPEKSAKILENMEEKTAAQITEIILN